MRLSGLPPHHFRSYARALKGRGEVVTGSIGRARVLFRQRGYRVLDVLEWHGNGRESLASLTSCARRRNCIIRNNKNTTNLDVDSKESLQSEAQKSHYSVISRELRTAFKL
jgi:hypothetical protein